jgi:hypothetical protein
MIYANLDMLDSYDHFVSLPARLDSYYCCKQRTRKRKKAIKSSRSLIDESKSFLTGNDISIEIIEFCIFDHETLGYFKNEFFNSLK